MSYKSGIVMDTRIAYDIERYISYGWGNSIIISLIKYQYDAKVSSKCINNFRNHCPCKADCAQSCPIKHISRWSRPYLPNVHKNHL